MSTPSAPSAPSTPPDCGIRGLSVNQQLVNPLIYSVENAFKMCELTVRVVGVTRIPTQLPKCLITGMIGMGGKATGFMTISLPERVATLSVSGLLQDEFATVNSQVVDGIGELTNIIAGGVKSRLVNSPQWMISTITIPSVIIGGDYSIAYTKGIEFGSVTFEVDDSDTLSIDDRLFMVTCSLMQLR
ncbi:MAG TPA: chemotaxis protein CheX [Planctomycetaceae bacterium]|nr:chemotaxis protein CheX [Planctomycetaceae bacterium]